MTKNWCKVCDEPLRPGEGAFVATCTVCGARQALPLPIDDEYLVQMGAVRRMRQSGDFDGARQLASELMERNPKDAALYWQRTLIHYQAVYRREQKNHAYSLECLCEDSMPVWEYEDCRKALELASPAQRGIYEEDARLLERARCAVCGEIYTPDETVSPLNSGFLCLEDGEWDAAQERFDCALRENPRDALAYFGKMMAELHVRREGELAFLGERLPETAHYEDVLQFGDDALRNRVKRYWEDGVLAHAAVDCEKAKTVDDWKHIRKMLQQIAGNAQARERIVLCERKIREIMVHDGMVVIGCREAVNLGLTTETLGVRMVNAHYYYDFDMPAKKTAEWKQKGGSVRILPIVVVLALLGLVCILLYIVFGSDADEFEPAEYNRTTEQAVTTAGTEEAFGGAFVSETEGSDGHTDDADAPRLCAVGERIFALYEDGSVKMLSGAQAQATETTAVSGASFAGNVSPYASSYSSWGNISDLYSEPAGEMLFGVTAEGLVVYDIFSASEMKYEERYKTVSSWLNVKELDWADDGDAAACLFALTKDGRIYASDAETEAAVTAQINPYLEQGQHVVSMTSEPDVLHVLLENGKYLAIPY